MSLIPRSRRMGSTSRLSTCRSVYERTAVATRIATTPQAYARAGKPCSPAGVLPGALSIMSPAGAATPHPSEVIVEIDADRPRLIGRDPVEDRDVRGQRTRVAQQCLLVGEIVTEKIDRPSVEL